MEELDKIVEKIKRLASGGNDTDMRDSCLLDAGML